MNAISEMKKIRYGAAVMFFALVMVFCAPERAYANTYSVDGQTVTYEVTSDKQTTVDLGVTQDCGPLYVEIGEDGSCTNYRFQVKNNTDKTINVSGWLATVDGEAVDMDVITSYGLEKEMSLGGNKLYPVFSTRPVKPGSSIWFENYINTDGGNGYSGYDGFTGTFRIAARFKITPGKETQVKVSLINKPLISVVKYGADKVNILVDWNSNTATEGSTKAIVYMGGKKIKTLTSNSTAKQTFIYSKKGAGSGKFKVKLVDASNSKNYKVSETVKPVKNYKEIMGLKALPTADDYGKDQIGFSICSVSYSGKTLLLKGCTFNTFSSTKKCRVEANVYTDGKELFVSETKNLTIKPGVHWYTYKVKVKEVIDLVNSGIRVDIR